MIRIRLEALAKSYGPAVAVAGVDLDIAAGEIFFLLGPSGCGKSTLLRLIAGLEQPSAGRIWFGDRDVTNLPTQQRRAVMCFQSYALWPHLTVRENVRFGLDVLGGPRAAREQRVDEVLDLVRMLAHAARRPGELSGGQQQRVALARALVVRPDCLLLDEPLSNLDAALRLEMRAEIRRICRQAGLTAIYVTHDQKEALAIADRLAILHAGRIEQVGAPQEVYRYPRNRFVAGFMGEANFIPGTANAVDGRPHVRTAAGAVPIPASSPGPTSGPVTLCIRPEAIRLGSPPADRRQSWVVPGRLHDTVYLGEMARHAVTLEGGVEVCAFELNPHLLARDGNGLPVSLWIDPADIVVLPPES